MGILSKKTKDEPKKKAEITPPKVVKTDAQCVNEGCYESKAPGQTHVCAKHIRT